MFVELVTGIIPIVLIFFSLFISFIALFRQKSVDVSPDENELIRYISMGAQIVLKRYISIAIYVSIGFIGMLAIANIIGDEPIERFIIVFLSVLVSIFIGWIGLQLSIASIKQLMFHSSGSFKSLFAAYQSRSQFILVLVISIALLDLSIWFIVLDLLITNDFAGLGHYCATFFGFEWTPLVFEDSDFVNKKHMFIAIIMSCYAVGSVLQTFLARISLSVFSVSFDSSSDLIGYTEYDLLEDDLRNPGSIPDQIGDQLKGNYLLFSNMHSIIVLLTISVAIIGGMVGVIEHSIHSMMLIELPIILLSAGVFVNVIVQKLFISNYKDTDNIFWQKFSVQLLVSLTLILSGYGMVKMHLLPLHIFYSVVIGLFCGIALFFIVSCLLSVHSKPVSYVKKYSKHSILGTLSSGFFIGFLSTLILATFATIVFWFGYLLTGTDMHVVLDLYHLGIVAVSIFVVSFSVFTDSISYAMVDNAFGISQMLSLPINQQKRLRKLNIIGTTSVAFFKITAATCVLITSTLFLLPVMLRCLKWLDDFSNLGLQTIHHVESFKSHMFDISADISDFIVPFDVHFLNAKFIIGSILGFAFLFGLCSFMMFILSRCYASISNMTHDELKLNPEIWSGRQFPNYFSLVTRISNRSTQIMAVLFLVLLILLIVTWVLVGIAGMIGFILCQVVGGVMLSFFFVVTGSIWSNAKHSIELNESELNSSAHVSLFFCDKLGDLFKDMIAPILVDFVKFTVLLAILMIGVILILNEGILF